MTGTGIGELAVQVAALLDDFIVEFDHKRVPMCLSRPDGACLVFREARKHRGRLQVTGCYPDGGDAAQGVDRPQITVAVTRGPQVIASEIRRRLLPEYERNLAIVRERQKRAADLAGARAAFIDRLMMILPGSFVYEDGYYQGIRWHCETSRGSITTYGNASTCRIEIDAATPGIGEAIARAVSASSVSAPSAAQN